MKRREFITLFGGAATAWPLAARAQRPAVPVIGYLYMGTPKSSESLLTAFHQGLSDNGYVEGRNVAIEYRWAHNDVALLPDLLADLVRHQVAVIVTPGSNVASLAAKAATTTIPIVFSMGGDPVWDGLVVSLNRPGGNITGITSLNTQIAAKRIGLLHELLPEAIRFAVLTVLTNRNNPSRAALQTEVDGAAATIGCQVEMVTAGTEADLEDIFASLKQKRTDALVQMAGPLFVNSRAKVIELAARYQIPTIGPSREYSQAGGLMGYGPSVSDEFRQVGIYTARVLKGEKPADLPVYQAVRFEFVINLKTAKALGVRFSPDLLSIADEVIE